jgi:hypothetical protein
MAGKPAEIWKELSSRTQIYGFTSLQACSMRFALLH